LNGERSVLEQIGGEFHHPSLNSPEPGGGVKTNGEGVLDVQSRLGIRVAGIEGSDLLGDLDVLKHLLVEVGVIRVSIAGVILELSDALERERGGSEGAAVRLVA